MNTHIYTVHILHTYMNITHIHCTYTTHMYEYTHIYCTYTTYMYEYTHIYYTYTT